MLVAMRGAALFSTFSLLIACLVKTRERFMGFGQVLTMPLFFASNAIYPIAMMPDWLQFILRMNPLTYEVDALRALWLSGAPSNYGVGVDILVLAGITIVLAIIAASFIPMSQRNYSA
jgi:ABC-2 type transport system permease protein